MPPSLQLPQTVTDLRAVRKGDKVYLAWTVPTETTDRQSARRLGPTQICRSLEAAVSGCGTPVGEAPAPQMSTANSAPAKPKSAPKVQASYADTLPRELQEKNPAGSVAYAIAVLNENGQSAGLSNQVKVPAAPTMLPPQDFKAQVTSDGVVLTWKDIVHEHETPELRHIYRVYRRQEGSQNDTAAGEVQVDASPEVQLVDHGFEWEKTYYYHATVVTLISQEGKPELQVEGDDTPALKVFADDIFPPAVPSGLQAVYSGVGQQPFVDLIWAPATDADLAGYNVYRHEEDSQPVKLNSELVKTTAYRDSNVQSGKKYFYSVSAVDLRQNESAHAEETSEAVP